MCLQPLFASSPHRGLAGHLPSGEKPGLSEGQQPPQRDWKWVLLLLGSWEHLDLAEAGLLQHRKLGPVTGVSSVWLTPDLFLYFLVFFIKKTNFLPPLAPPSSTSWAWQRFCASPGLFHPGMASSSISNSTPAFCWLLRPQPVLWRGCRQDICFQ